MGKFEVQQRITQWTQFGKQKSPHCEGKNVACKSNLTQIRI